MTCTDGGLQPVTEGKPHPRAYGAFPRKLARYVRDRGVVDLPFAIRSMTALSAEVFGLKDRGVVRSGRLRRSASSSTSPPSGKPRPTSSRIRSPRGFDTILVNGRVVRRAGAFQDTLPGRVLRLER